MSQNQRIKQKCIAYAKESCGELTRRHLVYQIVAPRVIRRHLRSGSRRISELTVPKASQQLEPTLKTGRNRDNGISESTDFPTSAPQVSPATTRRKTRHRAQSEG